MRFEFAFHKELEEAKNRRWPLIMPLGVLEYHGAHAAYGTDGLIPQALAYALEEKHGGKCVILPTFWYGPASYAVTSAQKASSINVDYNALDKLFCGIFESLLRHGWRNIYCIQFHQSEDLLPMQLSIMKAAKATTFKFLQDLYGEGWWGNNTNKDFYESMDSIHHPWNWIRVIRPGGGEHLEFDHAGKWETSSLMAVYPEAVRQERWNDTNEWFCQTAKEASAQIGSQVNRIMLRNLDRQIVWTE